MDALDERAGLGWECVCVVRQNGSWKLDAKDHIVSAQSSNYRGCLKKMGGYDSFVNKRGGDSC